MSRSRSNEASSSSSRVIVSAEEEFGGESIISDYGRRRSPCGYCGSTENTSVCHGLLAESITVEDYQELLDRGWRRSGSFLYKPEMERTCCPSYTIRLKAADFIPSKEQNRVLKKMERFLSGTTDLARSDSLKNQKSLIASELTPENPHGRASELSMEYSSNACKTLHVEDEDGKILSHVMDGAISACLRNGSLPSIANLPKPSIKKVAPRPKKKKFEEQDEELVYTSPVAFHLSAILRRLEGNGISEGASERGSFQDSMSIFTPIYVAEKIVSYVDQQDLAGPPLFSVRACNGHLNFYSKKLASPVEVTSTSEPVVKSPSLRSGVVNGKRLCIPNKKVVPSCKKRKLEISMKQSSFDLEEYALFRRYQISVHNEEPDKVKESSYRRFLVDTPLKFVPTAPNETTPTCGFGSFHQQYRIDGKLVAVGVVDVLPRCLSSKYLFWDPDFAFLSLGKFSALKEINWVKDAEIHCPNLQYYYLGYYIHSCPKMRYKASYHPSELLCPLRYKWVPFFIVKPLLDRKPYVILSDFSGLRSDELSCELSDGRVDVHSVTQHKDEDIDDRAENIDIEMDGFKSGSEDDLDFDANNESLLDQFSDKEISNIKLGLDKKWLHIKDLEERLTLTNNKQAADAFLSSLKLQLHKFKKVVGPILSERIVYSID